nr:hypothetical protein [Tanacetum cinerariifolium]
MNSYKFIGLDDVEEGEEINSRKKSFIKRAIAYIRIRRQASRLMRNSITRDRAGAHERLVAAFFSDNSMYDATRFRKMFRMARPLFNRIVTAVTNYDPFFHNNTDCTGREDISSLIKCTSAIRQLAYGVNAVMEIYGPEFLRKPTVTDIEKLYRHHEEKHGFSGMLGSLDCTDWDWFGCPYAFKGQYVRRDHEKAHQPKDLLRNEEQMERVMSCWSLTRKQQLCFVAAVVLFTGLLVVSVPQFHLRFRSGNGLTKSSLITHLRDRHCNVNAQAITKQSLTTNLAVFEEAEVTFKRMGVWLCGVCFKTHTLRSKCRHASSDFVPPPDCGDGIVRFVLYDLTKPSFPSCSVPLDHVDVLGQDVQCGFIVLKGALDKVICTPDDISCWVSLLVLPICLLKTFRPRSNLECKSASKRQHQEECILSWGTPGGTLQLLRETLAEPTHLLSDINISEGDLDLSERNIKQCKRKICDDHYTVAVRVLSSSGVAPYNEATLDDLKTKHPFKSAPFFPNTPIDHHQLMASPGLVLDMIKSFPRVAISDELLASITQVVNLFLDGKGPKRLGEYNASAPLTPLVKPGGGIRLIVVGTVWRRLVSRVCATMIGHSLDTYLNDLQFGVRVLGGGDAILHAVNRLIEDRSDDIGLSMLLVDFQNAFNLVDWEIMLQEVHIRYPAISRVEQGDPLGPLLFALVLHLLICKIKDSFSLSLHAWYLDDGTIIGDTLVMGKVLELIMKDGPRRGLHLNVNKTEVFWPREDPRSRLAGVFPPTISRPLHGAKLLGGPVSVDFGFSIFERAQNSFDAALRSFLERIVTAFGPGFGDWQWRLATLPFAFGGLGVYCAGDVLSYAFLASRLQSASLQTKLLRHPGIVSFGLGFDSALNTFNVKIEIDLLSNSSEIVAPKLMKKLADIYFTNVTQMAGSTFSISTRKMALWKSKMEDHTSDGLRVILISGLGQTMNGRTYRCDHAMSCAGIVGIKHRHNVVRDTLVDISYRFGISSGKEVDIGLCGERDESLRPADVLLYSWDVGRDAYVDLTWSSPLTHTHMVDFVSGRAVTKAAQRKRAKYEDKCADIRYGFLPFSFSSFGKVEKDAATLLKRIRKFSMAQDIGARTVVYIFNRISFSLKWGPR